MESEDFKIHIVCYEDLDAWILGKFARKLADGVRAEGVHCSIGDSPDLSASFNHHICYTMYDGNRTTRDTLMITHVNTVEKFELLSRQMPAIEMGICMSSETMEQLALRGLPRSKLCYINPAHDESIVPRRVTIGITHRIYADGRKGEHLLAALAARLSPDDFKFKIMGSGWEPVVTNLRELGFHVQLHDKFEHSSYAAFFSHIDYYLYFAKDEGSMGFVDALAAGVPTIVSAQGFHLDARDGITHGFREFGELLQIFESIAGEKRKRQGAVKDWTWSNYSRMHLRVWKAILASPR